MKAVVGSSKTVYLPLSSAVSSDGFKTANSSSVVSCKLWGHSKLDSRAILVFSRSRTAALGEFSDQSHLQFYAKIVCEKKEKRSKNKPACVNASAKELVQVCDGGSEAEVADGSNVCCEKIDAIEAAVKQLKALEDELKAKKQELKAKKKEMKAVKKSKCDSSSSSSESSDGEDEMCMDKRRMKSQQSEEVKAELKAKKKSKCESSSSSSESSDCENEMCMRMQSRLSTVLEPSSTTTTEHFYEIGQPPAQSIDSLPFTVPVQENLISDGLYTSGSFLLDAESSFSPALSNSSGRVEVCTGGKCRKDGSQQVLSAFQECVPATSGVAVSACKCMGKCGKGPNVRVHSGDDESNPQVYTAVSEEDTKFLTHYHFGIAPEQGIPVIPVLEANSVATDSSMCAA